MRTIIGSVVVSSAVVLAVAAPGEGCGGSGDNSQNTPDSSTGDDVTSGMDSPSGMDVRNGADGTATDGAGTDGPQPDSGQDSGPPPYDPSVYQHHKNGSRDGLYIDAAFTRKAAATTHVLPNFMGMVTIGVRAQPLYVVNGPNGKEAFLVATEDNHLTTYDATTGLVLWDKAIYGAAATGNFPCGNLNPLGITGTPVIDITSRTIYFDAMVTPDQNATLHHMVFAAKLDDGSIVWSVDVSTAVTGFDSRHQNQRGALQLVGGILYVPYGGNDGDCDPYYGYVVGFPLNNPKAPKSWHTQANRGGIWGVGALPTDGTSIFPITGNTEGTNTWGGGEAVIRLAAGPTFSGNAADYYAPMDWKNLDDTDLDLGGASEVLVDMPNAQKPHLVVAGGKDRNLYVLDRDNLGGIGGELLKLGIADNEINGGPAAYTTSMGTYVAFRVANGGHGVGCPGGQGTGNLVVAKITAGNPPTAKVAWCSNEAGLGTPMVTTTDGKSEPIVWDANNHLWGYDGDTGAKLFDGTMTKMGTSMQYFNTPIDAKGRIAVAVDGQLYVFTP
jgi:hypothetical protein